MSIKNRNNVQRRWEELRRAKGASGPDDLSFEVNYGLLCLAYLEVTGNVLDSRMNEE